MSATPPVLPDGLLVVFEGIDGVGKSTQLAMACKALLSENWPVHITRALGGTPIGEALRAVMLSTTERPAATDLYISLAIQAALLEAIQAERSQGKLILMDRGPLSQAAYEIYGGKFDATVGWKHVDAGMQQFKPELTLIYHADIAKAIERAKAASTHADYFEGKPVSFFESVAEGYQEAARRYPGQTVLIDADQSLELVHEQTMIAIRQHLLA